MESLTDALVRARETRFDPDAIRAHAEGFSREHFVRKMHAVIEETAAAPAGTRW
jgi:hypothetical protein